MHPDASTSSRTVPITTSETIELELKDHQAEDGKTITKNLNSTLVDTEIEPTAGGTFTNESGIPVRTTTAENGTPVIISGTRSSVHKRTAKHWWYHFFFPSQKGMKTQMLVSFGAMMISLVLVVFVLVLRKEIYEQTKINSGLLIGSAGTIFMCSIVIGSYLWTKWYRRHIHILLVNLASCDFLLALSFVLEPAWIAAGAGIGGTGHNCKWLSTVREYLIMCSTAWCICMAWDLYKLMTDPFTSPRLNRRKYQFFTHSISLLAAVIMHVFEAFEAPVAVGNFCWVGAKRENLNKAYIATIGIWLFIITPVSISMLANIYVTFISYRRFRYGLSATLKNRHVLLREGFLTTVTLIVYSVLVWGVYGAYWVIDDNEKAEEILSHVFAFLLSYRGSVTFILWYLYNHRPQGGGRGGRRKKNASTAVAGVDSGTNEDTTNKTTTTIKGRRVLSGSSASNASGINTSATISNTFLSSSSTRSSSSDMTEEENEDAMRPQMNIALLEELVFYTTKGIAKAVQMANKRPSLRPTGNEQQSSSIFTVHAPPSMTSSSSSSSSGANTTIRTTFSNSYSSNSKECKFTDFYPASFLKLRQLFGIDEDEYLRSLETCTTPKVSEGASGSFMFYSTDRQFIVKSCSHTESIFLHGFLDAYVEYVHNHRDTFITRFLGSYCIVLYGKKAFFVVMENVFDIQHGVSIHQRYDIKGSWVDRNAQKVKYGAEATCRHCNMAYRCGTGRDICPNRAGSHEPNVVLKDMDLTTKLRFGREEGQKLLTQLKKDSDFLCDQGIMDYSLLLGVIEVSYQVNPQNILTRDGSVFIQDLMSESQQDIEEIEGMSQNARKNVTRPMKQSRMGLRTSEVVVGPGFYYIGIIDILQTWNISKRMERFTKTFFLRKDPDGISAMPPKPYRDRFHKKLDEIIHLGHNKSTLDGDRTQSQGSENGYSTDVLHGVVPGDGFEITGQVRASAASIPEPMS